MVTITRTVFAPCCCPCTGVLLDSEGGEEGYSEDFNLRSGFSYNVIATFTAFVVADRLILTTNLGTLWDTGCIGEEVGEPSSVSEVLLITAEMTTLNITVIPLCGPSTVGTIWVFSIPNICIQQ